MWLGPVSLTLWLALPIFILLFLVSVGIAGIAFATLFRLHDEHTRRQKIRWLLRWLVKGLALPALLWALMNVGFSWELQPFMPQVQAAKNDGAWFPAFLLFTSLGWFAIASYWTAVTLCWILFPLAARLEGELRHDFRGLCWTSLFVMILPAVGLFLCGGWMLLGLALVLMFLPIVGYGPAILRPKPLPPMYARAIAKVKFGKYTEAEWDIIRELEKREDDFDGWMMLADLYATHFNDLNEAEQTILEICEQPKVTPSQISVALHKLADWHLKLGADPEAARRTLQVICDRLRGTHLARMAQARMEQLPRTVEELREQQHAQTVHLPALSDGAYEGEIHLALSAAEATTQANQLTARLNLNPDDVGARERLARIWADFFGRADLAIEQIELLLGMMHQSEQKRAEWLSLIAVWEIKHRHDVSAGRRILEQLISEFPQSAHAFAARQRLHLLEEEEKIRAHEAMEQSKPPAPKLRVDYPTN